MKNKIELTAEQLAGLDLLIAKKQEIGIERYADAIVNNANNVAANATVAAATAGVMTATPAAVLTATVGAVATVVGVVTTYVGGDRAETEKLVEKHFNEFIKNVPLDALIELRNQAIEKK